MHAENDAGISLRRRLHHRTVRGSLPALPTPAAAEHSGHHFNHTCTVPGKPIGSSAGEIHPGRNRRCGARAPPGAPPHRRGWLAGCTSRRPCRHPASRRPSRRRPLGLSKLLDETAAAGRRDQQFTGKRAVYKRIQQTPASNRVSRPSVRFKQQACLGYLAASCARALPSVDLSLEKKRRREDRVSADTRGPRAANKHAAEPQV